MEARKAEAANAPTTAFGKRKPMEDMDAYVNRMVSLGELTASIGHEISNPLTSMACFIDMLRSEIKSHPGENEGMLSTLDSIQRICNNMKVIVKGTQIIAKDGTLLSFEKVNFNDILEQIEILCQAKFKRSPIKLEIKVESDEVPFQCSPVQIIQVIMNLLNNAYQASLDTKDKWVRLEMYIKEPNVQIIVTDSGDGIPKEVQDKLLNPFFSTKKAGQGLGIGLSLSQNIMQKHQGQLYYNKDSANTSFVLEFPMEKPST